MEMCVTESNFLGKIPFRHECPKMVKNGAKMGGFGRLWKIYSLVLSGVE